MIKTRKPVIFCDFDGTITESDNIISIMRHFNPDGWEIILDEIVTQNISIKRGIGRLFALFPAGMRQDILEYVLDTAVIRKGFKELLDFSRFKNITFLVTSGGIDFFVQPVLASFSIPGEQIYCNEIDFTGPSIEIVWPHPCDEICLNDCGMCKAKVIRGYPADQYYRILIGDSISDFEGARIADMVFARSHLMERCESLGIPYVAYEDFFTVIEHLQTKVVSE